jgi:phytoene desaturase (3,4-didehydrolycopene-forming)
LLLPRLFKEAFYDLDTSLEAEGVELLKCEPNYNLWFGDGESFELSTDTSRMKREIEKWEGIDGFERYLGFLQESHRHYEQSIIHVLRKNFTSLLHLARPSFLRYIFTLHPFESIYYRASQYFYTERLRRVFTFGSMYMGMSPFDAPGTYSLLQYTELAEGIWYPRGGFHVVLDALVKVGKRMGVEYRLSTGVSRVSLSSDGRRAEGVTLSNGEELSADIVVVNADLVYAYNNLLPSSSKATSLSKKDASCSSISFYWAVDKKVPELTAHNIFLADDYKESFDDIFKRQLIPQEPSFYVNVPSRVDPSAAPEGKDTVVVLVPVGHLLENHASEGLDLQSKQDWNAMVDKAREKVLTTIESRTGAKMRHSIIYEEMNTPGTWKEKFNLDKGAILGLSHSFFNVLSFRPKTKHAKYEDLYFVGASTHPGTGVPICLAGSKVTTEQILDNLRIGVPWTRNGEQEPRGKGEKVEVKDIDRIQSGSSPLTMLLIAFLTLVSYFAIMR